MEDRDRLRREQAPPSRKSRIPRVAARVGAKIVTKAAKGAGSFISRGGIRNPDDMITRGRNRSLYVTEGRRPSPLGNGQQPYQGKELLTGRSNNNPRRTSKSRVKPKKKNTYNQMMKRAARDLFGRKR